MKPEPSADVESQVFECVEIYIPKNLEHLSELFNYLRKKLIERREGVLQSAPIDGFSMYEVDGAFYGEHIYQERTIVIRIFFRRTANETSETIREKIQSLGAEIASIVSITEEEFWICHYPQGVVIFRSQDNGTLTSH
jgi:hypothetical protein